MNGCASPNFRSVVSNSRRPRVVTGTSGIPASPKPSRNSGKPLSDLCVAPIKLSIAQKTTVVDRNFPLPVAQASGGSAEPPTTNLGATRPKRPPPWSRIQSIRLAPAHKHRTQKQKGREACASRPGAALVRICLVSRLRVRSGGRPGRAGLWHAEVARDRVLSDLVDHQLFCLPLVARIQNDRRIDVAVLFFSLLVFQNHRQVRALLLFVHALQLDRQIAHLLRLVLPRDGELDIVALSQPAEVIDFIVVLRNQVSQL